MLFRIELILLAVPGHVQVGTSRVTVFLGAPESVVAHDEIAKANPMIIKMGKKRFHIVTPYVVVLSSSSFDIFYGLHNDGSRAS
jgi:hypothetical protein